MLRRCCGVTIRATAILGRDRARGNGGAMGATGPGCGGQKFGSPEAAIIFDNLHSLHDVVSDILADPAVPRGDKRRFILQAAASYRDDTTSVVTIEDWKAMAHAMDLTRMGGPAPVTR